MNRAEEIRRLAGAVPSTVAVTLEEYRRLAGASKPKLAPARAVRSIVLDLPVVLDDRWRREAACRNAERDYFFSERGEFRAIAKAICAGCPVRMECLTHALDHAEVGVWGGMSERERRRVRRRRSLSA